MGIQIGRLNVELASGTTRCGIHGDDTTSGRCATCDRIKALDDRLGEGELRYDEKHGTVLTLVQVQVDGVLGGPYVGGLCRRAIDYWTVYADGVEVSFNPATATVTKV